MIELLIKALKYYGTKEIPGEQDNPVILNWFHKIGHLWVKHDETPNCSAFINFIAKENRYEYTGKLNARSWLNIGQEIFSPEIGDLAILWRISRDSEFGHIGFWINELDNLIYIYGANQGNQTNIKPYPKDRLLGYRRLRKI